MQPIDFGSTSVSSTQQSTSSSSSSGSASMKEIPSSVLGIIAGYFSEREDISNFSRVGLDGLRGASYLYHLDASQVAKELEVFMSEMEKLMEAQFASKPGFAKCMLANCKRLMIPKKVEGIEFNVFCRPELNREARIQCFKNETIKTIGDVIWHIHTCRSLQEGADALAAWKIVLQAFPFDSQTLIEAIEKQYDDRSNPKGFGMISFDW